MFALLGYGGNGRDWHKTTIARAFYQRYSDEFDLFIFLAKVGNVAEESGLVHQQEELLSRILKKNDELLDLDEGAH